LTRSGLAAKLLHAAMSVDRLVRRTPLLRWLMSFGAWWIGQWRFYRAVSRFASCGDDVHIQFPAYFADPDRIALGSNVAIAAFVHVWGSGGVTIGNRVLIASHVAISSVTHDHRMATMYGASRCAPVVIEDDVWVGAHAVVLPGLTIGRGAVIGAGSVVTKSVPANAIVMGVPGAIKGYRQVLGA
jgi:maltose O-acetyltransferase